MNLRFLTRPGCHLCDDARPLVLSESARAGLSVIEEDIERSDQLHAQYGLRIPVLLSETGVVVAEGEITDRKLLRKALKRMKNG
ncbi:MAG: glutaredoxin family protein [Acidimicrobiia bacterium]